MRKINLKRCEAELNKLISFLIKNYFVKSNSVKEGEMEAAAMVSMTHKKQRLRPYYVFEDNGFIIKYPAVMLVEDMDIRELVNFTFHELCHIYARIKEYPATSRKEMYHNKYFSFITEKCGFGSSERLEDDNQHIGYANTQISDEEWKQDEAFYLSLDIIREDEKIEIIHVLAEIEEYNKEKNNFSYVKFVCPECKNSAYASAGMSLICKNCNQTMTKYKEPESCEA